MSRTGHKRNSKLVLMKDHPTITSVLIGLVLIGSSAESSSSERDPCGAIVDRLIWLSAYASTVHEQQQRWPSVAEINVEARRGGTDKDPWQHDWQMDPQRKYPVFSEGRDGVPNTSDDVTVDGLCPYAFGSRVDSNHWTLVSTRRRSVGKPYRHWTVAAEVVLVVVTALLGIGVGLRDEQD